MRFMKTFSLSLPIGALALAGLGALLVGAPIPARAQQADDLLRDFQPSEDFIVVVDGYPVPEAHVYRSSRVAAILILNAGLPEPVLVVPRSGVETVSIMNLAKRPGGTIDILANATTTPQGPYQIDGENVSFTVGDKKVSLKPRPPLLGLHEGQDLRQYSPDYAHRASIYQPDPAMLKELRGEPQAVRVRIFFGSWCPHCREMVPHALKVEKQLAGSKIKFEYYGLPRGFGSEPEAKKYGINAVPTGIVYVGGKEVGRIEGNAWRKPEAALADILNGGGSTTGAGR